MLKLVSPMSKPYTNIIAFMNIDCSIAACFKNVLFLFKNEYDYVYKCSSRKLLSTVNSCYAVGKKITNTTFQLVTFLADEIILLTKNINGSYTIEYLRAVHDGHLSA